MRWVQKMGAAPSRVAQKDVKICALCDALNHRANAECFLCGWQGAFLLDARQVVLAWQRLENQYEEVRLEHVTGARRATLQEFGVTKQRTAAQNIGFRVRSWWRNFLHQRDLRAASREAALRSSQIKHSAP